MKECRRTPIDTRLRFHCQRPDSLPAIRSKILILSSRLLLWRPPGLSAVRDVPELEADVRARSSGILPIQLAAIVVTIRADRVNHHAVIESAIFQRRAVVRIGR